MSLMMVWHVAGDGVACCWGWCGMLLSMVWRVAEYGVACC